MDSKDETTQGGVQQPVPARNTFYQQVANNIPKAIETLVALLDSRNENVALGAAKALLNKGLPDLRSTEITGQDGEPIKLNIIAGADYLSKVGVSTPASEGSTVYTTAPLQDISVAPQSTQDNNSDNTVSEQSSA